MISLKNDSSFTVFCSFFLSEEDLSVLVKCYLPLIGNDAFSLYFALYGNENLRAGGNVRFVKDFLNACHFSLTQLNVSKRRLEGMGLLKTFYKESQGGEDFNLVLEKPLQGNAFLSNPALQSLLAQMIGEKNLDILTKSFPPSNVAFQNYIDASSSLAEVYSSSGLGVDLPEKIVINNNDNKNGTFDLKELTKELGKFNLSLEILRSNKDKVISLAILNGFRPKTIASLINDSVNTKNVFSYETFCKYLKEKARYSTSNVDYGYGASIKSSDQKLKLLDSLPSNEYLQQKLKVNKLPTSLLDLVYKLHEEYHYSNGVINAIFDYCISREEAGGLPNDTYIEKVAVSLLPIHPTSAYETKEVFAQREYSIKNYKAKKNKLQKQVDKEIGKKDEEKDEVTFSDKDLDDILDS